MLETMQGRKQWSNIYKIKNWREPIILESKQLKRRQKEEKKMNKKTNEQKNKQQGVKYK